MSDEIVYLLWDMARQQWFAHDGWGYTPDSAAAGQFGEDEAVSYALRASYGQTLRQAVVIVARFVAGTGPVVDPGPVTFLGGDQGAVPEVQKSPSRAYGELAYRAYGDFVHWQTHDGRAMPLWANLGERIQLAWAAAAGAIRDRVVAHLCELGEGPALAARLHDQLAEPELTEYIAPGGAPAVEHPA